MKLTTKGVQEIQEVPWGVYLWEMPDGSFVADDEGHFAMIASTRGDASRMSALRDFVRDCGVHVGRPCFFQGNRVVSDEEYEEQKQRQAWGLVPDPWDVAAIEEERKNVKRRR